MKGPVLQPESSDFGVTDRVQRRNHALLHGYVGRTFNWWARHLNLPHEVGEPPQPHDEFGLHLAHSLPRQTVPRADHVELARVLRSQPVAQHIPLQVRRKRGCEPLDDGLGLGRFFIGDRLCLNVDIAREELADWRAFPITPGGIRIETKSRNIDLDATGLVIDTIVIESMARQADAREEPPIGMSRESRSA
jgi:hypothetical protein